MVKTLQSIVILLLLVLIGFGIYKMDAKYLVIIGSLLQIFGLLVALKLVFNDARETPNKVAWIIVIFVIPVGGIVMYLFFGRDPRSRIFTNEQVRESEKLVGSLINRQKQYDSQFDDHNELAKRIEKLSRMKCFDGNKIDILKDGEEKFAALFSEIEKAVDHIHIQYYIYNPDELGEKLRDTLIKKANEGVKVRFLFDGWGSSDLKTNFLKPMHEAGIELEAYDPIRSPWIVRTANLRNHRKIVIIDGKVAFTGGLNIGNEYISKTPDFRRWRDTHLRMEGPAVLELQTSFLSDWVYVLDRDKCSEQFINEEGITRYFSPNENVGDESAQVIWGGPYDTEKIVRDGILNLIQQAKKSISISTPYFVPDEEALSVVRRAALSGVDVRILIPGKGDSPLSFHATNSYRRIMLKAGARVFNYDDTSFIHNKIVIVDDEYAAIGTANFDIRSFQLNHELMVFLFDEAESVKKLAADFAQDCKDSIEYTMEMDTNKSGIRHAKEAICRMFSPIL